MLAEVYPDAPWLPQTRDAIELCILRCLTQLNGPAPTNSAPIRDAGDYRERPRTAEEIKAEIAAEEGTVSRAPKNLPRYREVPDEVALPEAEIADPRIHVDPRHQVPPPARAPAKKLNPNEWPL